MDSAIAERGRVLLERYGLGKPEDYEPGGEGIFYGDEGLVEHVLHEVCHAMLLDIPLSATPNPYLSKSISLVIDQQESPVWEEAKCWAVEWHCIQALELGFEWGDVTEGANIQGCYPGQVKKFYEDPESLRVAQLVLRHMREG